MQKKPDLLPKPFENNDGFGADDQTMRVPSMEAFAQMANAASTPFHGRRFVPEEDENTCAVNIVFKKPELPEDPAVKEEYASTPTTPPPPVQMSPIMETSREHNYRSSSSSGNSSHSQFHLTKSHLGNNTELPPPFALPGGGGGQQSLLSSRTPGTLLSKSLKPTEMTNSGYMADASSARTPGEFLVKGRSLPQSPQTLSSQNPSKKAKINLNFVAEDDEEEPTAMLEMMGAFKKNAGISDARQNLVPESPSLMKSSFLQHSLKASFLEPSWVDSPAAKPALDVSMPPPPAMTPQLNVSSRLAAPTLSGGDLSLLGPPLPPDLDLTTEPPPPNPSPEEEITQKIGNISICEFDISKAPFSGKLHAKLLENITQNPVEKRHGFFAIDAKVPAIKISKLVRLGPYEFIVTECKGEGAFGKVYSAVKEDAANPNETIADMEIVLKVQKPKNVWEFYIASELHRRLNDPKDRRWFMSIPRCFVYHDGSVFVSEKYPYSLLDVCNRLPAVENHSVREIFAAYFGIELLHVIERLHKAKIIHGDVKPDNFLVQRM